MPRRDGTGPMGIGGMTGRGLGVCTGVNAMKYGVGFGNRRGLGRYIVSEQIDSKTQKEILEKQKDFLKKRVDAIDQELDNL